MIIEFFKKYRTIWLYGIMLAGLMFVLKWAELKFLVFDYAWDIYAGLIAVFFTGLGIWLALKLARPKTVTVTEKVVVEKTVYVPQATEFVLNESAVAALALSAREMDVLQLLAAGLSNKQIGEQLFVSVNTVKTHCAKIFEKLEVTSRMQAITKAKSLGIVAG